VIGFIDTGKQCVTLDDLSPAIRSIQDVPISRYACGVGENTVTRTNRVADEMSDFDDPIYCCPRISTDICERALDKV
jgi:hypothetical protein